jgi:polyhydroxybutyrate depolymerase
MRGTNEGMFSKPRERYCSCAMRLLVLCLASILLGSACGETGQLSSDSGPTGSGASAVSNVSVCSPDWPDASARVVLNVDGVQRSVHIHLPPAFAADSSFPIVMAFHGAGANAEAQRRTSGLSEKADAEGFVIAYPEATGSPAVWPYEPGDARYQGDDAFVEELVDDFIEQRCVDPRRVFATGFSNGGWMAERLACTSAKEIAAVATVSAAAIDHPCEPERAVPFLAFHGVLDPVLAYGGGPIPGTTNLSVLPVETWVARWALHNGCTGGPVERAMIGRVQPLVWTGCAAPVILYRVEDGGHTWPHGPEAPPVFGHTNTDVSATDTMWAFFVENPLSP